MARDLGIPYTDKKPFYFVSYNSEDEKRVSSYVQELSKHDVFIWYDIGLKIGEEWEVEIAEKIDECHAVIMFLSKNIFAKGNSYVHKEFELAKEYSKKKVYVMMLDHIDKPDVPIRFRTWWTDVTKLQCINTFEFDSSEKCIEKLIENLGLKSLKKSNPVYLLRKSTNEKIFLNEGEFFIGRDAPCHYCIPDNNSISRIHGSIIKTDSTAYFVDLMSTNYSFLNGTLVEPKVQVQLNVGDTIKLGTEEFIVCC